MSNPPKKQDPWAKYRALRPERDSAAMARMPRTPNPVARSIPAPAAPIDKAGKGAGEGRPNGSGKLPAVDVTSLDLASRSPDGSSHAVSAPSPASPARQQNETGSVLPDSAAPLQQEVARLLEAWDEPASVRKKFWRWPTAPTAGADRRLRPRLAEAWRQWRGSAMARVTLAYVILFAALAVLRRPSPAAIELARHGEDAAALQAFYKSYGLAGGTVFAERRRGAGELYPRGVVMQGELLEAFRHAPVGRTFVAKVSSPDRNPLLGFDGFSPVYVGGSYFHLTRTFSFSRYHFTFLLRKDSDEAGALLMAHVQRAR